MRGQRAVAAGRLPPAYLCDELIHDVGGGAADAGVGVQDVGNGLLPGVWGRGRRGLVGSRVCGARELAEHARRGSSSSSAALPARAQAAAAARRVRRLTYPRSAAASLSSVPAAVSTTVIRSGVAEAAAGEGVDLRERVGGWWVVVESGRWEGKGVSKEWVWGPGTPASAHGLRRSMHSAAQRTTSAMFSAENLSGWEATCVTTCAWVGAMAALQSARRALRDGAAG